MSFLTKAFLIHRVGDMTEAAVVLKIVVGVIKRRSFIRGIEKRMHVWRMVLIIEARKENWQDALYTSTRLVSKNKGDWKYGRIEIKAQLPKG
ncbi:MAG: hypothetical protein EBQ65_05795, partial [Chitinophagaceae bacterium]|nr:hypothetical protein [Chitinophagaceae bacterium]